MEYHAVNKAIWLGCILTWKTYYDIIFCEKAVSNCVHTYTLYNHNYVKLFIFKRWNERSLCLPFSSRTMNYIFLSTSLNCILLIPMSDYYGRPNRISEYYCRLPKNIHILIHRASEHVTLPSKKDNVDVLKLRISRFRDYLGLSGPI